MKTVRYVGPFTEGVAIPYGQGEIPAPHGEPVEVPDDLAKGLLDQPSNWEAVKAPKKVKEANDVS